VHEKLMGVLKTLGTHLLSANPAFKALFEELLKVAERAK
jgi:hypothetical protein